MANEEQWKAIPGYEGAYEVSSHGRVKAVARLITYTDGRSYTRPEQLLKTTVKQGYPSVSLPGGLRPAIHSLVAAAFIGAKPKGARTINHKDGNKNNNHFTNLEWASYSENNRHARLMKLNKQHAENCNLTKFSDDKVDAIRLLWPTKRFTQLELANLFGMSENHVYEIIHYKSRVNPTE